MVRPDKQLYKGYVADILAVKDNEKYLIEIKTSWKNSITDFINRRQLTSLPGVSYIFLALPSDEVREETLEIARRAGFGIFSVSSTEVKQVVDPRKLSGNLSFGGSFPSSTLPGRDLDLRISMTAHEKIFTNVKINCLEGGPFFVPQDEPMPKVVSEVLPEQTINVNIKLGIRRDAEPGTYSLYIEQSGDDTPSTIWSHDISIQNDSVEMVKKDIEDSVGLLNRAITLNLDSVLTRIDEAITSGIVNIRENVISESLWVTLGNYCISNGLYRQAQRIFERMLKTISIWEERRKETLHKGLAFYNLGVALYYQGKTSEAKSCFQNAYDEDKRTYGESGAEKLPSRRTLEELFKTA